ncbi:Bro-N domain-containing protein [Glaesserella parasuis]|uniref:BRO-N domain-containing protein n=1 Tax=Glaesserella parasuis TaxID=738 RepID=UPI0024363998|nr:Bro-N domain-containing protein [Glaesserella parasuis]MDG6448202.1 Bro-N domain-containing protein [Glaesserella parasuis]
MTTLTFQTTTLSVINQQNQIWLSALDIGKALGYSNGDIGVKNIYNRHQDEFTPNMTALIDMQTNGGVQKVRIFSLRGCHLIGMLSHTKVAKDFRKWVLDILDREILQNEQQIAPLTITPEQQRAIQEAVQQAHYRTGLHWQEIYSRLKSTFNVAKYDQLPQTMFEHVINFLNTLGNQYRPIDRSKKDITIAGLDAEQIAKYLVRARAFAKEVEVFHRKLYEDLGISRYVKNDIAGKAYDIAHEFNVWLDPFIEQVLPQLNQQRLARF